MALGTFEMLTFALLSSCRPVIVFDLLGLFSVWS